jgi:uncharacterized membrane protein
MRESQKRIRSKVVWGAVAALVLILIGNLGLYEKIGITQKEISLIIDAILSILVMFGILNNPTDKQNF